MTDATLAYLSRMAAFFIFACWSEGLLIAASWALWSRLLRLASPTVRHRMAVLHFAGFSGLPILSLAALQWTLNVGDRSVAAFGAWRASPIDAVLSWLSPVLALVWAVGAAVCAARLITALWSAKALKTHTATDAVAAAVKQLGAAMGLKRGPAIAAAAVRAPQVTGGWRSVVIVPADIEDRLTPTELKAVLSHELVHVRCGDYGWNLFQRWLLVLTWFHPGAWLVHSQLRLEREMRCDEQAARRCARAADLAMALVRLAEPRTVASGLAQSAASGPLNRRVLSLMRPRPKDRPRALAPSVIVVVSFCVLAFGLGRAGQWDPAFQKLYLTSIFSPAVLIEAKDAVGVFRMRIWNGHVLEASIGSKGAPTRIVQHGSAITLLGRSGAPLVTATLTPRGGIQWSSRRNVPQT